MKITVIGGSGFIGTYLCQRLAEKGVPFEIIDIKESVRFPGHVKFADIRDLDALRIAVTGNAIIHLAAVHRDDVRDKALYYETNVKGSKNVCTAAIEKNISTLIFTSSVAVYGFALPGTGEDGAISPFNDYGKSKFEAEEVLRDWMAASGDARSLTIVRPTVVFGVGNRGNVYNLLKQIFSGYFVMVGGGKNVKSLAYVENVAAFLEYATTFKKGYRIFNYTDGPSMDMNQLVLHVRGVMGSKSREGVRLPYLLALGLGNCFDVLSKISGRTFPISAIRVRKFCANTFFTSSVHDTTEFNAPVSLSDGLNKTIKSEFVTPDTSMGIYFTE